MTVLAVFAVLVTVGAVAGVLSAAWLMDSRSYRGAHRR